MTFPCISIGINGNVSITHQNIAQELTKQINSTNIVLKTPHFDTVLVIKRERLLLEQAIDTFCLKTSHFLKLAYILL